MPDSVAAPVAESAFNEHDMLQLLVSLGIDLEGFSLDNLDPIETYTDLHYLHGERPSFVVRRELS
jgi:hypothetical protein